MVIKKWFLVITNKLRCLVWRGGCGVVLSPWGASGLKSRGDNAHTITMNKLAVLVLARS